VPVQTYLPTEILDYLETHAPPEDVAFGISQRELAKALGYHPCSMSRPLHQLASDGMVRLHRGVVRGGIRKQLVYKLTDLGRDRLRRETRQVPLLTAAIPPPPNPFLGRREELRQLEEFTREGGGIVFVEGSPGMGKTALVSRFLRRVRRDRVPFWFPVRAGTSPRNFILALAHALSSVGAQQLAYYSQLPKAPIGREVADLVGRALGDRRLVGVIDDLQFAAGDMRKFLGEFIVGLSRDSEHLFIVLNQESAYFEPIELAHQRIVLGGLDRAAAHELTDRKGGLEDRFEAVYQASLGSPLLLQLAISNPGVEASVSTLPAAVVDKLSRSEVSVLLPVALANEPLPASFVEEAGVIPHQRIQELIRTGVLQKTLEGRLELLQVVKTALASRVSPREEREAHVTLAGFYGRSHRAESVRERFIHLVSGESWKSASQILSHQERTLLSLGYSEVLRTALRHLILAMTKGTPRVKALKVEAALLRAHSDFSDAILSLRRAIDESENDPKVAAECLHLIVELYVRLRQLEDAERTLAAARKIGALTRRLQVFLLLSEARISEARGELGHAHEVYQSAFELSKKFRISDLSLECVAAWSRIVILASGPEAALRMVEEALPEARQSGRLDIVFNLLVGRGRSYSQMGKYEMADQEFRQIRTEAEALGYLSQLAYILTGLAAIAGERSAWADVQLYAKQACSLAERLGDDLVLGHTLANLCSSRVRQAVMENKPDLLDEAESSGIRSVEVLSRIPPTDSLAFAHGYLVEVYTRKNESEKARLHLREAERLADQLGLDWLKELFAKEFGNQASTQATTSTAA
jgi:tetratricopeptide (TPR) repeat protein/DNA-binding MarR family transcriptional regulator